MINIDLRRESPQNNVNRILALESLIKYYPLSVIEEIDKRVVLEWVEEDSNGVDVPMKQIDMAFVLFGLPTPELKHLMEKIEKRMRTILEEQKKNLTLEKLEKLNNPQIEALQSSIPEVKLSLEEEIVIKRKEREIANAKYRQDEAAKAQQRVQDHLNGIVIEDNKEEDSLDKNKNHYPVTEINYPGIIINKDKIPVPDGITIMRESQEAMANKDREESLEKNQPEGELDETKVIQMNTSLTPKQTDL